MLRDEVFKYTELTGEDGNRTPIMKIGAYLDGCEKGLSVLDKIRAEIESIIQEETVMDQSGGEYEYTVSKLDPDEVFNIIDKYRQEERIK